MSGIKWDLPGLNIGGDIDDAYGSISANGSVYKKPSTFDVGGVSYYKGPSSAMGSFNKVADLTTAAGLPVPKFWQFDAVLNLLSRQGNVSVSSPRISTLNNQKAVIKVGKTNNIATSSGSTSVAGNTGNVTNTQNLGTDGSFSGVALAVTPHIDDHGGVTMHVRPIISDSELSSSSIKVTNADGKVSRTEVPVLNTTVRESDSIVKAQNGEIIVIGGLIQKEVALEKKGVPGDKTGGLLDQNIDSAEVVELVILLKPVIVDKPSIWKGQITDFRRGMSLPKNE